MAAVAFDSLEYAHQLEAAGMPRKQAEVVAKGLTVMFIHNFDALVTRDYLDIRFTEFETRIEAKMDRRFTEVDRRFDALEQNFELRFERIDSKFSRIYLMFGATMVAVTIPILQNFFSG
jgi:hypothetical protein